MPSKNSRNKKIKLKLQCRFRDGGYIILVEKPNKQGKVNPWHILNTTPSLNCCTLNRLFYTVDTLDKIEAIVQMRKTQTIVYTDAVTSYLNV